MNAALDEPVSRSTSRYVASADKTNADTNSTLYASTGWRPAARSGMAVTAGSNIESENVSARGSG